jgi:hypothetical protein
MKILIEIDSDHYDGFLNKCSSTLPEYAVLKNGFVLRREIEGAERRMIAILCDKVEAQKLLVTARDLHLPAANDIARALGPMREI